MSTKPVTITENTPEEPIILDNGTIVLSEPLEYTVTDEDRADTERRIQEHERRRRRPSNPNADDTAYITGEVIEDIAWLAPRATPRATSGASSAAAETPTGTSVVPIVIPTEPPMTEDASIGAGLFAADDLGTLNVDVIPEMSDGALEAASAAVETAPDLLEAIGEVLGGLAEGTGAVLEGIGDLLGGL